MVKYLSYFPNYAGAHLAGKGFGQKDGEKGIFSLYNEQIAKIRRRLKKIYELKREEGDGKVFESYKVGKTDVAFVLKANANSLINYATISSETERGILEAIAEMHEKANVSLPFDYNEISDNEPSFLRAA